MALIEFFDFNLDLSTSLNLSHTSLFLLLLLTPWEFFISVLADGLSLEFEWQQVSRTLLSILAVLNNVVVWMVSTCPLISKSSSPFNNPLVTVPKALIIIGIIVTFMFYSFFQFSSKVEVLILLFIFFLTPFEFFTPVLIVSF